MANKRICFDFDGVVHSYTSGWKGVDVIPDPPVDDIKELFKTLHDGGWEIVIFTTRAETIDGINAIWRWLTEYNFKYVSQVTNKKLPALIYVDDRAINFNGDVNKLWNDILDFE